MEFTVHFITATDNRVHVECIRAEGPACAAHIAVQCFGAVLPVLRIEGVPPCYENGRCVGHERYPGAGTLGLRYCDENVKWVTPVPGEVGSREWIKATCDD